MEYHCLGRHLGTGEEIVSPACTSSRGRERFPFRTPACQTFRRILGIDPFRAIFVLRLTRYAVASTSGTMATNKHTGGGPVSSIRNDTEKNRHLESFGRVSRVCQPCRTTTTGSYSIASNERMAVNEDLARSHECARQRTCSFIVFIPLLHCVPRPDNVPSRSPAVCLSSTKQK